MTLKQACRTSCATLAIVALLQNAAVAAGPSSGSVLVPAAATGTAGAHQYRAVDAVRYLPAPIKIELLRQKVKYVFVIFQENRSFDHYFGTYPGANGLFDAHGKLITTPNSGTTQRILETDGTWGTISPFLIPQSIRDNNNQTVLLYPEDTVSIDHSHNGMVLSAHFKEATHPTTAQNDAYALNEEKLQFSSAGTVVLQSNGTAPPTGYKPSLLQKQRAEVAVSHIDCDTIPFLWNYADRFTLFDNFHQTIIGPSTPNAIAVIAGQSGETQWALHPSQFTAVGTVPVTADPGPFPGSNNDNASVKPPYGPNDVSPATPTSNLTFATLPLSFMGSKISQLIQQDQNPTADLLDVQHDIATIASFNQNVNWGWYQQGFDAEPFGGTLYGSYITHHNGPQYFGYLGDNKAELKNLHGLGDFFSDVAGNKLPAKGGVFYVRGGYASNDGLVPVVPNSNGEQQTFAGNDDHPGYSDAFLSEAQVADSVNAIANSPYWKESAIIITYDETDGLYDHAPMNIRSWEQSGNPLAGGPRIPAIVVSPYSAAHTISTQYSEHSSVIKFIDELFGLVPLADLPDEQRARKLGHSELGQDNLGPADDLVNPMGDLLEAFDNDRLIGIAPLLPASYATIPNATVQHLPHYNRNGCSALGITPTDYPNGLNNPPSDPAPGDFNPRPSTAPGIPAQGSTTLAGANTPSPALTLPWKP